MLDGKRMLITGVMTARLDRLRGRRARAGAGRRGRADRLRPRAADDRARGAHGCPSPPDVLELDVNAPTTSRRCATSSSERWGGVDGVLHAIAFAPADALGGNFLRRRARAPRQAFETSAYSLKALAAALPPLLRRAAAARRRPRLRRLGRLAGLRLDGRRQGGAGGGQPLPGPRPRARTASASTSSRPARSQTPAAARHPRLRRARRRLGASRRRSAGTCDDPAPVADAVLLPAVRLARAAITRRDRPRRRRLPRRRRAGLNIQKLTSGPSSWRAAQSFSKR